MFDASAALAVSRAKNRVEMHDEQDRLDITNKIRTSVLPWRGQFSPELIEYLIEKNSPSGGFIVDPFCGSGTVLYEAARHGLGAYAVDINPAAICLARFSEICLVRKDTRLDIIAQLREFLQSLCALGDRDTPAPISAEAAANLLSTTSSNTAVISVLRAALLLAFGNQPQTTVRKIQNAGKILETTIASAPVTDQPIECHIGDARRLNIEDDRADYLVTSPPYINVFNYHQNYRPITEALGYTPLPMARAEIGANRKHRQNRYMTVVQYCIDMALFFVEAKRVLKPDASMTIVLGRTSNVRGVAFPNGEIIAAIASEGLGWSISSWRERKFMNRFGETIFEDVLTLSSPPEASCEVEAIGRSIGVEALREAVKNAPVERCQEIENAIESATKIHPSPYVLDEAQYKI